MTANRTKVLVEIALTIALAAVLHFVRVWQMPAGGSVSLEMLPLLVLGLRRGPAAGLAAGLLFGVVDYFIEPYFVHWAQLLLDYPLAFGAVGGLCGLLGPVWRRSIARGNLGAAVGWVMPLAVALGSLGRYAFHFASGVVFFATTVMGGPLPNGTSAFGSPAALGAASAYSAIYNLYVPISAVACLAIMFALMPTLERVVPVEAAA